MVFTSTRMRFAAAMTFLLAASWSLAQHPAEAKFPKVTATVELPAPPVKVGDIGPFTAGPSKPVVVTDDDKKKLDELAKTYQKVAKNNYDLIVRTLHCESARMHDEVHIVVTYRYNGVAATSGSGFGGRQNVPTIQVSAKYALAHPDDIGMVVHEMVHVVQSYPTYDPSWLVEGIADYVRWFFYEPVDKRPHPSPAKATARDSYRTTAAFLFWASEKYSKDLVPKLNDAFQANQYKESLFKDLTGKTLDELNAEWIASLKG
ncbi:MAG: basic secretory protein-like protein [Fimbriimonadales bacterium]